MIISIFIILGLYITLSYWIGIKGKRAITGIGLNLNKKINLIIYWMTYWIIALSFILSNVSRGILTVDNIITEVITLIGAIYLGIFVYSILIFSFTDILRFILKNIKFRSSIVKKLKKLYFGGASVFLIIFIIIGFGVWNAQNKVVTNYEVNINKKAGEIKSLNVVMISDVHMGIGVKETGVSNMVNSINELKPDVVVFCGDIFDESTETSLKEYSREAFKNIKSKYGVFAITGNHEYNAGDLSQTISFFEDANIKFLKDEYIKVADSFYIVGRNDKGNRKILEYETKSLNEILKDVDKTLPCIVLDHRPDRIEEAEAENTDLQLSGHTHNGQMFPGNLITNFIYEDSYGYLNKCDFNLIVSSGYGTWGPPIRIGSKSEIVNITVNFKK